MIDLLDFLKQEGLSPDLLDGIREFNAQYPTPPPEEQLWDLLHCTPGSATILGLMNDDENRVQLLIDKETYEAEYFSCHPCLCTSTIKLKTSDVKNMLLPKVHHEPIVVEL